MRWVCARRGHVVTGFGRMRRVRHFQMTDDQIGGTQGGCDAAQPIFWLRLVQNQVAGENQFHAGLRND